MNLGMIKRVFLRFTQMKDLPAYTAFLEMVDAHGDAWKVPQRTVAEWWESRQSARLSIDVAPGGGLSVSCSLGGAAVEVDGDRILVPPFELSEGGNLPAGPVRITCGRSEAHAVFLTEVLGHLGYGHVERARNGERPDIPAEEIVPSLESLFSFASEKNGYDQEMLARVRSVIRDAHHRRGLPDLRLWTLPHRDGRPYRVCVSTRYDVDRAICNLPFIHELEAKYGLSSTAYIRAAGSFYGRPDIERYARLAGKNEIALHGEFVTTAGRRSVDEFEAAVLEKRMLENIVGVETAGVCMHGGELRSNTTPRTKDAIEKAGFRYETMYRNGYYLPLHLPHGTGVRRTISIGQHFADITAGPERGFSARLLRSFTDHFSRAVSAGGVFVPVMHPLYFGLFRYLRHPRNMYLLAAYMPRYFADVTRMRRDQFFRNNP
jgi:hypothetical protein